MLTLFPNKSKVIRDNPLESKIPKYSIYVHWALAALIILPLVYWYFFRTSIIETLICLSWTIALAYLIFTFQSLQFIYCYHHVSTFFV